MYTIQVTNRASSFGTKTVAVAWLVGADSDDAVDRLSLGAWRGRSACLPTCVLECVVDVVTPVGGCGLLVLAPAQQKDVEPLGQTVHRIHGKLDSITSALAHKDVRFRRNVHRTSHAVRARVCALWWRNGRRCR